MGIEKTRNNFNLLLFDPGFPGNQLQQDVQNGKLTKIRRSQDTFTKDKYQIVYVEEGFFTESEEKIAKKIESTRVTDI